MVFSVKQLSIVSDKTSFSSYFNTTGILSYNKVWEICTNTYCVLILIIIPEWLASHFDDDNNPNQLVEAAAAGHYAGPL